MQLSDDSVNFLKYAFTETKDLTKSFLTVVTAVLVFSLTFSEKIANFSGAWAVTRWTIVGAWSSMFLAVLSGGIAICYIALSGGAASSGSEADAYWRPMRVAIRWLVTAGVLFVVSLVALIVAAVLSAMK
jgi:hypothetical protein